MNIELEIKDIKHDLNYAKKCEYEHVTLDVYKVQHLLTAYEKEKEKNKNLNWYFENQKNNFVHKDKLRKIIYPSPENPIPIEVQQSEMYKRLLKEVEETNNE